MDGLGQWEKVFGPDFAAVLVFAYWLQGPVQRSPFDDVHLYREKPYAFVAVPLADYVTAARPRSAKWKTIAIPAARFADLAHDIGRFL